MLKEFKEFAAKGNMLDMAVGIVIGAAFASIISSLVNDVLMPPIGLVLGGVDFSDLFMVLQGGDPTAPYATLAAAQEAGAVTIAYGQFLNSVITFFIVAFWVYDMKSVRKKVTTVGAIYAFDIVCLAVFGGALGWI